MRPSCPLPGRLLCTTMIGISPCARLIVAMDEDDCLLRESATASRTAFTLGTALALAVEFALLSGTRIYGKSTLLARGGKQGGFGYEIEQYRHPFRMWLPCPTSQVRRGGAPCRRR